MEKITPFLWFNDQAEEAANFYVSIFKGSKIETMTRYPAAAANASGRPAGSVMTVVFQINGQQFIALNGGPHFHFTEAVSFVVKCETQAEIDEYWEKLSAGGQESRCGWLKDKYGLSWQIVPAQIEQWLKADDPEKSARVMHAVLQMRKLDWKRMQAAYDQQRLDNL